MSNVELILTQTETGCYRLNAGISSGKKKKKKVVITSVQSSQSPSKSINHQQEQQIQQKYIKIQKKTTGIGLYNIMENGLSVFVRLNGFRALPQRVSSL